MQPQNAGFQVQNILSRGAHLHQFSGKDLRIGQTLASWCFQIFLIFTRTWGRFPI